MNPTLKLLISIHGSHLIRVALQERAATAALVEKHSKEMITLISEKRAQMFDDEAGNGVEDSAKYPAQPPPPVPPSFAKTEIYRDPTEFADVDRRAINVAQEDQKTFTDLVSDVIGNRRCFPEWKHLNINSAVYSYRTRVVLAFNSKIV